MLNFKQFPGWQLPKRDLGGERGGCSTAKGSYLGDITGVESSETGSDQGIDCRGREKLLHSADSLRIKSMGFGYGE